MAKSRRPRFKSTVQQTTVAAIIGDSFSEFETLKGELEGWKDSLEEKFSGTNKYQMLEEAVDALEVTEPDVDEALGEIEVEYTTVNPRKITSRAARRDEATRMLSLAIDALNNNDGEGAEDLANELQEALDQVEGAEFPGMYS